MRLVLPEKQYLEKKCRQRSLSCCSHLSTTPAAAPVLAGAAPKPNPPANAQSKAYNALAISGKIRIEKKY